MLRQVLKILHEVGSIGMVGTLAACIVLIAFAPTRDGVVYAAVRQEILALTRWLLVPSLVLISGLLTVSLANVILGVWRPRFRRRASA